MFNLSILEQIIADQSKNFDAKNRGVIRDIQFQKYLANEQIVVISGIRRSGKSTLSRQFADLFDSFYYVTFDDERLLDFQVSDFNNLMLAFKKSRQANTIFIDEVQNVPGWERFVRRLHEEGYKIFVTGSNAKLLSSELATHLTGRYFKIELYPFSFREFLRFGGVNVDDRSSAGEAAILNKFDEYFVKGGFPEMIAYNDLEFVKRIYEDVLFRDIISRFKVKDGKSFKQLASFLFSNVAKETSYNFLSGVLGAKKTAMTVRKYVGYLEEAYLVFEMFKYDFSLKKQFVSNKKIYVIDNGLRNEVAFYMSEDRGRLLENLVFIELKRRGLKAFYYKGAKECDFLIKEKNKITAAIQVTAELNIGNRDREVAGILEAMKKCHLSEGLILTLTQSDEIKKGSYKITVLPVWKWLTR